MGKHTGFGFMIWLIPPPYSVKVNKNFAPFYSHVKNAFFSHCFVLLL